MASQVMALLVATGYMGATPLGVPGIKGYRLVQGDGAEKKDKSHIAEAAQQVCGQLNYLATGARYDIKGPLHPVQQKAMEGFSPADTAQASSIIRYLRGSPNRGIRYNKTSASNMTNKLVAFADASYIPLPGRSPTCAMQFLNGGLVAMSVSRAPKACDSAPYAELCAAYDTVLAVKPARDQLDEMGLRQPGGTPIFGDNQAVLTQIDTIKSLKKAQVNHAKVGVCRVAKDAGEVVWKEVASEENRADLGTKPRSVHFTALVADMG